jgi:3-hydroxyacyl-[acyl-carrier-protein] dehydratase
MNPDHCMERELARLPHGQAFRFIDRLVALVPGVSGVGEFTLKGHEPFLEGHFPGNPIMPGVLLIEAAAQLGGVVAQSDPDHVPLKDLKLAAVRNAKILGTAQVGEVIRLEARVEARLGALVEVSAIVKREADVLLRCALTLAGRE